MYKQLNNQQFDLFIKLLYGQQGKQISNNLSFEIHLTRRKELEAIEKLREITKAELEEAIKITD